MHDELSLKLLLLAEARLDEMRAIISRQRALYLQHLRRPNNRRDTVKDTRDEFVMRLLLRLADMRLRADLAWLDLIEAEVAKRRAASAGVGSTSGKER